MKRSVMDRFRMFQWLVMAAAMYGLALMVSQPQLQIVLWKTGHITVASFVGYWIDRAAFKGARLGADSDPLLHVRRAVIIGCAMLAISMGL